MRNISLEKSYTNYNGEASPRAFYKKSKIEYISGSTIWNIIKIVSIVCPIRGLPKYSKT